MFSLRTRLEVAPPELLSSKLYDEKTFYPTFMSDLRRCRKQVVIEPFITGSRMRTLLPEIQKLRRRGRQHYDQHT